MSPSSFSLFSTLSSALILLALFTRGSLGGPKEKCQARNETYAIADDEQCDKYYECYKGSGKMLERLCADGFVFSEPIHQCDYPHNTDCKGRPKLQPSTATDPDCERANGFYPFPASVSCQKFYHCLENRAYEKTCPEGIIFDHTKGTCMHPDLANRPDCAAATVLGFKCPNLSSRFTKLRFGDHDRHPHPNDCRKFYICLHDGKPRLGGCPLGKVFNSVSGFCDKPKHVQDECKNYYITGAGKMSIYDIEAMEKMKHEEGEEDDDDSSEEQEVKKPKSPLKKASDPNVKKESTSAKGNLI